MSHGPEKICVLASIIFAACLCFAPRQARANTGTQLNFNEWQAGTEQTTLVPNGNFETGDTTDWTPTGEVTIAAPVNPPTPTSATGAFAMQTLTGSPTDTTPDNLVSTSIFSFNPTDPTNPTGKYVISAYMWAFNDAPELDLIDPVTTNSSTELDLQLTAADNQSGSDGYFVYAVINASDFPNGAQIRLSASSVMGSNNPNAQFDNIAITPFSQFLGPQPMLPVPEPASLSIALLSAGGLLMRRRK